MSLGRSRNRMTERINTVGEEEEVDDVRSREVAPSVIDGKRRENCRY